VSVQEENAAVIESLRLWVLITSECTHPNDAYLYFIRKV